MSALSKEGECGVKESDVTLVRRMQQKDPEAFDEIFERYHNRLLRMAYLISGSYADSEDIVQETFIKCYCNCRELKDCSRFPSWLYQILTRTAWRYAKKSRREEPVEILFDENFEGAVENPMDTALKNEEQAVLWEAVSRLEIKQRTVVILYYYNQLSTKEISRVLGCMEGTVKSRLHTARKNLEQSLNEEVQGWKKKSLTV